MLHAAYMVFRPKKTIVAKFFECFHLCYVLQDICRMRHEFFCSAVTKSKVLNLCSYTSLDSCVSRSLGEWHWV